MLPGNLPDSTVSGYGEVDVTTRAGLSSSVVKKSQGTLLSPVPDC
jgi:hypothetical protein